MFLWHSSIRPVVPGQPLIQAGFTDRTSGVGAAPYAGLNLGGGVGDEPVAVEANRQAVASAVKLERERLLFMSQVQGATVVTVTGPLSGDVPAADGVVTTATDLALAVLVADCVPLLLHDGGAGVIGAVHAGRPGMMNGIVAAALERMRGLGADHISAIVGPSVCARCYEVPEAMAAKAAAVSPASAARSWSGTHAIDVAAGVVEQLRAEGVAVHWLPGCTREDERLYSYRRDGRTGRFAGLIVMRSGECEGAT